MTYFCISHKRSYLTKADAKRAARAGLNQRQGPTASRPYRCRKCKRWHLTKATPRRQDPPA